MNDEDGISKLPDEVLIKILSFLDLKSAIRTTILSKRWKPLWTFLQDFDFDFNRYRQETDPLYFLQSRQLEQTALLPYVRFVNGVLSNRDNSSKIGKFRLASNVNVDPIFVRNCIQYAASHNVEDLDLAVFHHPVPVRFPPNFFESRSLYKLRLKYYYSPSMIIPKPFCLPSVKILYLERFPFKDDDDFCFTNEPFSDFPNLEELTLDCCIVDGLMILAPELKIINFLNSEPHLSYESKILKAAMPKLESFRIEGQISLDCSMDKLPCLDEVYVDLCPILESPYRDEVKRKMQINLIKLLEQLNNAKTLTVSLSTIEVISNDTGVLRQHPSPFVNLKNLKFVCLNCHLSGHSGLLTQNIMTYLTSASSFSDSMTVEYPKA